MYAGSGMMMLPFMQGFDLHQELEHSNQLLLPEGDLISSFTTTHCNDPFHLGNLVEASSVLDYDLGIEGDLFDAPEAIIAEPILGVDAVAVYSDLQNENLLIADIESIENENLLSAVYSGLQNELLAEASIGSASSDLLGVDASTIIVNDQRMLPGISVPNQPEDRPIRTNVGGQIQKSSSTGCLSSMDWLNDCSLRQNFLELQGLDLEAAFGMRRAHSENDIQTLRVTNLLVEDANMNHNTLRYQRADFKSEERRQKLSRYRKKKNERNFARKIKYACRKALADIQPRVRGRFAKTEDCNAQLNIDVSHEISLNF